MRKIEDIRYSEQESSFLDVLLPDQENFDVIIWFYGGGYLHPLKNGADFVAESLHKTLPALTGSALLIGIK